MKTIKPKIGIPVPTSMDIAYNQRSWGAFAHAVSLAGGEAVCIGLDLRDDALREVAASCNGLLLPGSPADIDPGLYHAPRIEACGPADPARERLDFFLLQHAQDLQKPVLGICYGCQSMNTFFGGSLIQDLSPLPVNHEAGAKVAVAHTALIPRQSLLGSILLGDEEALAEATPTEGLALEGFLRLPVNTSHHQSVAIPGAGMQVSGRCPEDEVVEAIEPTEMFHVEHPGFLLGVQWHPERSVAISAMSRALFARLIAEARTSASARQSA